MIDRAIDIVRQTPRDKYKKGCSASFVKIDSVWGIKFYSEEDIRDDSYEKQTHGYINGVAPRIGDKIDFSLDSKQKFGYITEIAHNIPTEIFLEVNGFESVFESRTSERLYDKMFDEIRELPEYLKLMEDMEMAELDTFDMHPGNIGYLSDGRLVCIDFDNC